jgi:hypothetical protein
LSALNSSKKPTLALIASIATMITKSSQRRTAADRPAAASIIQGIGPQKKRRNRVTGLTLTSASAFRPWRDRRLSASSLERPPMLLSSF